jgi:hypothetical protein
MPVIQTYEQQVLPQGQFNAQATPEQMGAGIGRAISDLGDTLTQIAVEEDVTTAHTELAKKDLEWQQRLEDMANEAQPGDETFVPRVMQGLEADFEKLSDKFNTSQGQASFRKMSVNLKSKVASQAIAMQAKLRGDFAKNQYTDLMGSYTSLAAKDHTQVEDVIAKFDAAIDDPNGRFARVSQATRDAFKMSAKEEIKYSAALGFARRYPNAVLDTVPTEIRDSVRNVVANPTAPGLPPDFKADIVKPYDQGKIDFINKRVMAPSPYDSTFKDAARMYNMDWRELKMRSVAESNLNPTATSVQNAGGIMQFTPETAADLDVDRNDPVASIYAAAKLLHGYRTKAGGDMTQVDMMYYGGASGKAWGPNTKQYAANLAATRVAVGLGSAVAPEDFSGAAAESTSAQNWKKARTGIGFIDDLPANKFFQVLTDAEQYQRAYESQAERSLVEERRQKEAVRQSIMDVYLKRIIDPNQENGGPLSELEVIKNDNLETKDKEHVIGYMAARTRELASRANRENPEKTRELMVRIYAPENDPQKIYNNDPIYAALKNGEISTNEFNFLNKEVSELRNSSTNGFRRDVNNLRSQVSKAIMQNITVQSMAFRNPELPASILYQFDRDLEAKIDALRNENKDPSVLLDPSSKEYVLKPGALNKYIPMAGQALRQAAAKAQEAAGGAAPPTATTVQPPPKAIEMLRANPALKPQFDLKYGKGAADRYLNGAR